MNRFLPIFALLLVLSGTSYPKGTWWKVCSQHWEECKTLYLEWKEKKAKFAQREVDCVRKADSVREMTSCLRWVRKERKKSYREWKRKFNAKFHQWVGEMREKNRSAGKEGRVSPERESGNKTDSR